jgi:hypothetical protein
MAEIDPLEVYKLRNQHHLSWNQIADLTATPSSTVRYHYDKVVQSFGDRTDVDVYSNARAQLLNLAEERLVHTLLQPDKLEKASLNNVAYALTQVHTMRRLEQGQSTNNVAVLSQVIQSAKTRLVSDLKQDSVKENP